MAVPKKRTSRSKKKIRKTIWREKANQAGVKALSLARSILTGRSKSFCYATVSKSSKSSGSSASIDESNES
uniref:Large ribosomal subunit protein bL32c n=1 Tax=Sphagnum rubiginosum TaxID=128232 RepID=A0A172N6E2_9BRYO|nr:ribosomal protein L32 [Sphagnum rubiginosum]